MPPLCVLELWIFLKEMEIRFCASNAHSILSRATLSLLSVSQIVCFQTGDSDAFSWDSYQIRVDCVHSAPCLPSKGMDLQLSSFLATPSRTHCPMGGRRCFCYTQISLLASFKMHVGAGKLYFTKYDLFKSQCRQIGDFGVRTKTESNGRWKNKQMRM